LGWLAGALWPRCRHSCRHLSLFGGENELRDPRCCLFLHRRYGVRVGVQSDRDSRMPEALTDLRGASIPIRADALPLGQGRSGSVNRSVGFASAAGREHLHSARIRRPNTTTRPPAGPRPWTCSRTQTFRPIWPGLFLKDFAPPPLTRERFSPCHKE
jgi:hypothetical protein